jgi:hypothetical protein
MACLDPLDAYERLRITYSRNTFTAAHTPKSVGEALRQNVEDFISDEDIPFILQHPRFDVAVHTVRARGPAASETQWVQGGALIAAAALNILTRRAMDVLFHRVVFFSGIEPPQFVNRPFRGSAVRLTAENLRAAGLATGSLPYVVAGVKDIPGAAPGAYRDGGLIDYQLNENYCPGPEALTLFFHYQERIVPGWFDKHLTWRQPPRGSLDRVLQVFPGPEFVELLPDSRIPDRNDFRTFVSDPAERIRRWDEVSRLSEILGEEFLEDIASGRIRELVRPLER